MNADQDKSFWCTRDFLQTKLDCMNSTPATGLNHSTVCVCTVCNAVHCFAAISQPAREYWETKEHKIFFDKTLKNVTHDDANYAEKKERNEATTLASPT